MEVDNSYKNFIALPPNQLEKNAVRPNYALPIRFHPVIDCELSGISQFLEPINYLNILPLIFFYIKCHNVASIY